MFQVQKNILAEKGIGLRKRIVFEHPIEESVREEGRVRKREMVRKKGKERERKGREKEECEKSKGVVEMRVAKRELWNGEFFELVHLAN